MLGHNPSRQGAAPRIHNAILASMSTLLEQVVEVLRALSREEQDRAAEVLPRLAAGRFSVDGVNSSRRQGADSCDFNQPSTRIGEA